MMGVLVTSRSFLDGLESLAPDLIAKKKSYLDEVGESGLASAAELGLDFI